MISPERALDALGDRTRRVFMRMHHRACAAGELAEGMDVTRSDKTGDWCRLLAAFAQTITAEAVSE